MTVGPLFFAPSSAFDTSTLYGQIMAYGPQVYWRLGEASGTVAADASGNGRPGTYVGSPTLGTASIGPDAGDTAITTSGSTGQYVSRGFDSWMSVGPGYSLFVLVNPSSVSGVRHIVNADDGGAGRYFQLRSNGTALELVTFTTTPTASTIALASGVASGAPMCLGCTVNNSTGAVRLFKNGSLVANTTFSGVRGGIGTNGFRVGAQVGASGSGFAGVVDEFAYFTGAGLSDAQHLVLAQRAGYA